MATISTSINTNDAVLMNFPGVVEFTGGLIATSSNFSWSADGASLPPSANDIDIHGSGFTYTGSGDARELASGTITRISIDIGNDNGSETHGDLVITGTEGLIASNIDKDDARVFWNEILKGDDVFILTGLAEVDIGHRFSSIFGDDLASATISTPGVISDQGGNDTIVGADNFFQLIGDVVEIEGFDSGEFGFFPAEYDAGDDTILSAITDRVVSMFGDANRVDIAGILHGGNDILDNSNSTGSGITVGDAFEIRRGGTVFGGNDTIDTVSNADAERASSVGDVFTASSGTLIGGDDVIVAHGRSFLSGDVGQSLQVSPAPEITIDGGNDRITGSASDDHASGDVGLLGRLDGPLGTLLGGNDTIFGEAGDDKLYGEYGVGSFTSISGGAVSGGNDQLDGGEGNDRLFGQTGVDTLQGGDGLDVIKGGSGKDVLDGGAGADRLTGGVGADTLTGGLNADRFIFTAAAQSGGQAPRSANVDAITDMTALDFIDWTANAAELTDLRASNFDGAANLGAALDAAAALGFNTNASVEAFLFKYKNVTYAAVEDGASNPGLDFDNGFDLVVKLTNFPAARDLSEADFI